MIDRSLRRRSRVLLAIAVALVLGGLAAVATYVVHFVGLLDQADQSMAFWLLPLLQFGLAAAGSGTVLAVLWLLLVSTDRSGRDGES
ncbi:MAG: hypothetical protein V2J19_07145 [Wenzhouxiangella sp.]|jgi:hypothetical protein|nr:hypothetical protein [Wenzhouxiangella sp.]